jgi:hypothetical protein
MNYFTSIQWTIWARIAQSVYRLATGWTVWESNTEYQHTLRRHMMGRYLDVL